MLPIPEISLHNNAPTPFPATPRREPSGANRPRQNTNDESKQKLKAEKKKTSKRRSVDRSSTAGHELQIETDPAILQTREFCSHRFFIHIPKTGGGLIDDLVQHLYVF